MLAKFFKYIVRHWLVLFIVVVALVSGVLYGSHSVSTSTRIRHINNISSQTGPHRQQSGYEFIEPLLWYDVPESKNFQEYASLKQKINDLINQKYKQGKAQKASVYFRDLQHGRWVGINTDDKYAPASLLKVPLMIAYFHQSETEPAVLNKLLVYHGSDEASSDEIIKPSETIQPGTSYTVGELMRRMIVFSDNNATNLLLANIDQNLLNEVYTDLGMDVPDPKNLQDTMSAKVFSSFFRILYNSTYLNRADSEQALKWLSESNFASGMKSGLPEEVAIAHKFGVRTFMSGSQTLQELHECGIIYMPQNNFLLCMMTKGQDVGGLENTLADITKLVYTEVATGYRGKH